MGISRSTFYEHPLAARDDTAIVEAIAAICDRHDLAGPRGACSANPPAPRRQPRRPHLNRHGVVLGAAAATDTYTSSGLTLRDPLRLWLRRPLPPFGVAYGSAAIISSGVQITML